MGKLRVIFGIGLAYPLDISDGPLSLPITLSFPDTGNTVHIDPPEEDPYLTQKRGRLGAFEEMTLAVERECTEQEGRDTTYTNNEHLNINRDAGRAFWQLFETLRELESRPPVSTVAGYPVSLAENIESNPLVRTCTAEWRYDGVTIQPQSFGGISAIGIRRETWAEAARRLGSGEAVPAYRSFALDGLYFATSGDPLRAIIMACAGWETALRAYLEIVAAKRDPAYGLAAKSRGLHQLYEFAKIARGGPVFYDEPENVKLDKPQLIESLPSHRNKLLHSGVTNHPEGRAELYAAAVLDAIDWLFQNSGL